MMSYILFRIELCSLLIHSISSACLTNEHFLSLLFTKNNSSINSVTVYSDCFRNFTNADFSKFYKHFGAVQVSTDVVKYSKLNILKTNSKLYLNKTMDESNFWHYDSIYMIESSAIDSTLVLNQIWTKFKVSNVLIVRENGTDCCVETYDPQADYVRIFCRDDLIEVFNILRKINECPSQNLVATGFQRETALYFNVNGSAMGYKAEIINEISSLIRCNIRIRQTSDGGRYGTKVNGTAVGAFKDLLQGEAHITANGHFVKWYDIPELTFTHYITDEKLCIFVPKALKKSHLLAVLESFDLVAFLMFAATVIIVGLFLNAAKHLLNNNINKRGIEPLALYGMMLGISARNVPNASHERIIIGVFLLMNFIIVCYIQSSLITALSAPLDSKNIDTIEELKKSKIEIWLSSNELCSTFSFNEKLAGVNIKLKTQNESYAGNYREDIGRVTRLNNHYDPRFYEYIGEKTLYPRHIVKECLGTYLVAYVIRAGTPIEKEINLAIARIIESGLFTKWITASKPDGLKVINKKINYHIFKSLSGKDSKLIFSCLSFGYIGGLILFILELICKRSDQN